MIPQFSSPTGVLYGKMLLVSYLYNISERQTEEVANLNLAVKYSLGLGLSLQDPVGKGRSERGDSTSMAIKAM